ncbi:selenocysteine-specific translation elongation factor, partial [Nonomuraea sp. NPDC050691]|uniref:selenocysteine-specific translation elongation factor n=1 Tax=Nonomuraea sp. NPDC050691 TaxID=3155661 RepID=UPI0033E55447
MTHVVATAGHVDHGKSTLVRALTGMEPDRLEEERRRGLTIELGYAWTVLPSGERLAFVDVPGHERFLATMLAGVGPVPAVMFVVAADEGWMPQSEEHLVALKALGVRHGVLAVTRADLVDPEPAAERARDRLREAGLGGAETVAVSGRTGQGLDGLRAALDRMVAALPPPDPSAPVRLWVDRAFSVTGSGTVVTGTLPAGTVAVGDELLLAGEPVRVRALESLKEPRETVPAVARVAVNLRGHAVPERGQALVTPGRWTYTDLVDVRVSPVGGPIGRLPGRLTVHVGSAAVVCEVRPLDGPFARLRLARPLPLHLGDVLLLRDPGRDPGRDRAEVRVLAGATVLDVRPAPLRRRGAARRRAALLETALRETPFLKPPLAATALPRTPLREAPLREAPLREAPLREAALREAALREAPLREAPLQGEAAPGGDVSGGVPGVAFALRVHGLLRAADLRAMGVEPPAQPASDPSGPARAAAEPSGPTTAPRPAKSPRPAEVPRREGGPRIAKAPHPAEGPCPVEAPGPASAPQPVRHLEPVRASKPVKPPEPVTAPQSPRAPQPGTAPQPETAPRPVCGDWYADPHLWDECARRLMDVVRRYALDNPLEPGMPVEAARHELGLPDRRLVVALVRPPLTLAAGRIAAGPAGLPAPVAGAVERLRRELAAHPFQAPEAARLAELGLGGRELAAAVRAGALLRVGEGVVLL